MPPTRRISVTVTADAPPDVVYRLLADAPSWPGWAGPLVSRAAWEVAPGPDGRGGIRRLGRPPLLVREEVTAAEPGRRHAYRMLSGQPVRRWEAEVILGPAPGRPGRTAIEWTGVVEPLVPGTGLLVAAAFGRMVGRFARGLAAAAR